MSTAVDMLSTAERAAYFNCTVRYAGAVPNTRGSENYCTYGHTVPTGSAVLNFSRVLQGLPTRVNMSTAPSYLSLVAGAAADARCSPLLLVTSIIIIYQQHAILSYHINPKLCVRNP